MSRRWSLSLLSVAVVAFAPLAGATRAYGSDWLEIVSFKDFDETPAVAAEPPKPPALEIVSFKDFDDVTIKIDGQTHTAFFIGLAPMHKGKAAEKEKERIRKEVLSLLKQADLFTAVEPKEGAKVGLWLTAFSHMKHGFKHKWDPSKYPWCVGGWGAYNFNLYFLHLGMTTYEENYDVRDGPPKEWFDNVLKAKKDGK